MSPLSDIQTASLLEEIASSMRAQTPMIDSMKRLHQHRLGGVGRVAGLIGERLERGEPLPVAIESLQWRGAQPLIAAINTAETTSDPGVIDRLAAQFRQRSVLLGDMRLGWVYPWLLLAVGYVVGVLVMAPVIRNAQSRDMQWPRTVVQIANWIESGWWLPPIVALAILIGTLVWFSRRQRFSRAVRLSLFCNSLADQFSHDVPEDVAIRTAAELSGDAELRSISSPTLGDPKVASVVRLFETNSDTQPTHKQSLVAQLRYLANVYSEVARRSEYIWSRLVPRCAMVFVGGGITLAYVCWVILPVYSQMVQRS